MEEKLHVNCDALEAAARRLETDRDRINGALEALEGGETGLSAALFKRRSAAAKARRAAAELERERLFLLECAKRFRGEQTRAVKRSGQL